MSYRHLTLDERNVICTMQVQGYPLAEIARCLGRHRSTLGRECTRNADFEGRYLAGEAQAWAHSQRRAHPRRPKTGDRRLMTCVAEPVAQKLQQSLRTLPADKRHSLTLDNDREFARPTELARRRVVGPMLACLLSDGCPACCRQTACGQYEEFAENRRMIEADRADEELRRQVRRLTEGQKDENVT